MPGLSAHSGSTEIASPESTAAVMTVAEKLVNRMRYSRFMPVEHVAGGAPPDAGRPPEGHRQHFLLVRRVVRG